MTLKLPLKLKERLEKIEGIQTIESIIKILKVSRTNAIRIVHELRKRKMAETVGGGPKKRLFKISSLPIVKEQNNLYSFLSKNSKISLNITPERILFKPLNNELAIIESFLDKNFRVWIAALALFKKELDWNYLSYLAIEKEVTRVVGAFYDATRKVIRVRKMPLQVRKRLMKYKYHGNFPLKRIKNKDFAEIEKSWSISIPFSKEDIRRLKE